MKIKSAITGSLISLFAIASFLHAADFYVSASGGSSSGSCPVGTPCTLSRALSAVTAGDTIILNPGTYNESSINLTGNNHQNIKITTTLNVINALGTFNRGIPTGTDNRPYFPASQLTIGNGISGVVVEYVRIRRASTPQSGWGTWAVAIYEPGNTVRYSELWNGTAIAVFTTGPLTFNQNYLHDSGLADGDEPDTHTFFMCRNSGCGGDRSANATSWNQKVLIEDSTFGGQSDSDQIQLSTGDDGSGKDNYIEISRVDFTGRIDEQIIDSKGSDFVMVHDCNFLTQTGVSDSMLSSPIDFVAGDLSSNHWWIYNNVFKPANPTYQCINMAHGAGESDFWIWNNVFDGCSTYPHNQGDQRAVGDWGSSPSRLTFVHNTVVNSNVTANVIWSFLTSERSDNVIRNNIFYNVFQTSGDDGAISTRRGNSATVSHNYFNVSGCPSGQCTNGSNAVINSANPLQNIAGGNYMPVSGSVVINSGYTGLVNNGLFTPTLDKNGNARGSSPDIGALEFGGTTPPPPPTGSACDLNASGSVNVSDVQVCANQAIRVAECTNGDINHDTECNVVDVQRVVNAALGGQCVTQ